MSDLSARLERLGLSQYLDAFVAEGFDTWETLLDITESDLAAANVRLGHRRKLQRALGQLRDEPSPKALGRQESTYDGDASSSAGASTRVIAGTSSSSSGTAVTKRKYRRHPKPDENAPERPPTAYVVFSIQVRESLRGQDLSFTELAKEAGERWQHLSVEAREQYERQADMEREKYYAELAAYKQTPEYQKYLIYLEDFKAKYRVPQQEVGKESHPSLEKPSSEQSNPSLYTETSSGSRSSYRPSAPVGFSSTTGPAPGISQILQPNPYAEASPTRESKLRRATAPEQSAIIREYESFQANQSNATFPGENTPDLAWSAPPSPVSETFSLASKDSTVMTSASTLTQSEMRKASDELLHIFLEDHEMNALFIVAICERFVSRNTFIDNFRRLLRFFSTDLKNEVQDSIYLELANFISQKSTFIAREVYRVLEYDHARTKSSRITLADPASDQPFAEPPSQLSSIKPQEDPGFEDEEEIEHDEKFDVLVAQGRKFVEGSKAFEELRKDFRNFVMHQPQPRPRIYSPVLSVHVETILRHSPARWSTAYQSAMAYLAVIGFREPRVPVGHKRIRWENAHGRKLYDDYIEHEPGALDSLQKYLDTYNYQAGTTVTSQAYGSSPLPPCWITRLWDNLLLAKRTPPPVESPAQRNEASNSAQNDVERGENPCRTLHLLCSMVKRRFANGLHQELVTDVTSDRDLFLAIRDSYLRYRGILKPYLSLTTVHSIHFMKFRYGGEEYIDLRCHDDLCERGKQCDCVPPPENTEYEFNPRLPKWSPPIGPQLMMDRFTHPDEIQPDDRWIIDQLPKRAKGKLERATTSSELQEAWGIYFKESLDLVKIWIIVAVGFVLPSLLFGVLWGHLRNDIQGAFGVASVWITCGTVFMGLFASYTWRSWV